MGIGSENGGENWRWEWGPGILRTGIYIREVGTGPWDKGGGNRRIGRGVGRVTALSR